MPLDGITAKCLAGELNQILAEARLDRIFQPDRHDILLQLRKENQNYRLILSANPAAPRLHLTSEIRDNPSEPPMFCMLLRKHLLGARLLEVSTPGYERIFQLRFLTINELGDRLEKRLIIEIMGRHSNIMLLNHENRIHDAIQHVDQSISRVREIMPARVYVLPPDQKKLAPQDALALLESGQDWLDPAAAMKALDKALLETLQGFSPQLCLDVLVQAGLDSRLKPAQLSVQQHKQLNLALKILLHNILAGQFQPTTFYDQPQAVIPIDFHALPLNAYAWSRPADSVSQAMDLFYLERNRQNSLRQKRQSLEKIVANNLEHVRRKWQIHEADRTEGENRDQYRRYGELILAGLADWVEDQPILSTINYFDPDQSRIDIPLEPGLSATQNAQRYFRLYAKARTRFETGSRLALEDQAEINWLESLQNALANAVDLTDIEAARQEMEQAGLLAAGPGTRHPSDPSGRNRQAGSASRPDKTEKASKTAKTEQPGKPGSHNKRRQANRAAGQNQPAGKKNPARQAALPPRQYTSSDGLTILVGRNNLQNDQLTLKTVQKDDIWLHIQKMPGTHAIIRTNRQAAPDRTLQEAAEIAAWFSRASAALPENRPAGGQKVAVDYCPVAHVRKPAGARPGMVIYDHYQTLMVVPKDPQDRAEFSP